MFNEVTLLDVGLRCKPHRLVEERKKFAVVPFPGAVAETGEVQGDVLDRRASSFPGIAGAARGFSPEINAAAREDARIVFPIEDQAGVPFCSGNAANLLQ